MRSLFGIAFLVAGCTSAALPGGDGGLPSDNDGSVAADLSGMSCTSLANAVAAWITTHQVCTVDSDCTTLSTGCGLVDQCGGYVNTGAQGGYFSSLLQGWQAAGCGVGLCAGCPNNDPGPPGCNMGLCGARLVKLGNVGDACGSGADCATGMCLGAQLSKLYLGGYCTVVDCDHTGAPACPGGSTCKDGGDGHQYCLKDCNPSLDIQQCRQGYACCSGPGPSGMMGWCAPNNASLCLSM